MVRSYIMSSNEGFGTREVSVDHGEPRSDNVLGFIFRYAIVQCCVVLGAGLENGVIRDYSIIVAVTKCTRSSQKQPAPIPST